MYFWLRDVRPDPYNQENCYRKKFVYDLHTKDLESFANSSLGLYLERVYYKDPSVIPNTGQFIITL